MLNANILSALDGSSSPPGFQELDTHLLAIEVKDLRDHLNAPIHKDGITIGTLALPQGYQ
jgi:hypothetical protein